MHCPVRLLQCGHAQCKKCVKENVNVLCRKTKLHETYKCSICRTTADVSLMRLDPAAPFVYSKLEVQDSDENKEYLKQIQKCCLCDEDSDETTIFMCDRCGRGVCKTCAEKVYPEPPVDNLEYFWICSLDSCQKAMQMNVIALL